MMDFNTSPSREPRYVPPTEHRRPVAAVPAPKPPVATPEAHEAPAPRKRAKRLPKDRKWLKILIALVIIAAVAWLAHGYISTKNQLEQLSASATAGQSPTQQLVSKVGKLVDLPTGETPVIYTVNNASKLKNQAFFSSAQNGDKVLIYYKAGKAFLYRPTTQKVVDIFKGNFSQ